MIDRLNTPIGSTAVETIKTNTTSHFGALG